MDFSMMAGKTVEETNALAAQFAALSTEQIKLALARASMGTAAARNANVFNLVRNGDLNEVVGTLKAGCARGTMRNARKELRRALREYGLNF